VRRDRVAPPAAQLFPQWDTGRRSWPTPREIERHVLNPYRRCRGAIPFADMSHDRVVMSRRPARSCRGPSPLRSPSPTTDLRHCAGTSAARQGDRSCRSERISVRARRYRSGVSTPVPGTSGGRPAVPWGFPVAEFRVGRPGSTAGRCTASSPANNRWGVAGPPAPRGPTPSSPDRRPPIQTLEPSGSPERPPLGHSALPPTDGEADRRVVPWWAWLLLGWMVVATACATWWARALANAETQDTARRLAEETRDGEDSQES
jgi:hypothetical protein